MLAKLRILQETRLTKLRNVYSYKIGLEKNPQDMLHKPRLSELRTVARNKVEKP